MECVVCILNFRVNYTNIFLRKLPAKKAFPFLSKRYVPFSDTNTNEKKNIFKNRVVVKENNIDTIGIMVKIH